jgi:hypothetical protein
MIFDPPPRQWVCTRCDQNEITPHNIPNRYHECRGMAGLNVPMVPRGSDCTTVAHEHEDYVGTRDVQYDGDGRPIMTVTVDRADGSNDTVVYAPTAHANGG